MLHCNPIESRALRRLDRPASQFACLLVPPLLLYNLQAEATDEVAAEVGAELQALLQAAVAAAQRGGGAGAAEAAKLLRALEAKLSAVEGSVLSAGGCWACTFLGS